MLSNKVKILLLKDYFVPVSNLSNLRVLLTHLILIAILGGKYYYYPHFL